MKSLQFRNNFKNFLYDLNFFITIYENHLHVFNYSKLLDLDENEIILLIDGKRLYINGSNMIIKKMTNQEMLITGNIIKVEFKHE